VRPLDRGLARFRAMRREIEASVLPLATSVDGRRFSFQASLHGLRHRLGGYVVLEDDDGTKRLGQILAIDFAMRSGAEIGLEPGEDAPVAVRTDLTIRYAEGHGVILEGDGASFHDAEMRPATVERLRAWVGRATRHAALEIGRLALVPDLPCRIDAGGFDRHTFLCGQSGSGKTYSLGVILERLLLETRLRIVILDPNSDFVRLGHVRAGADPGRPGDTAKQRAGSRSIPPAPRTGSGSGWHCASSRPPPRPPCCGSIRSRTATSTRSSRRCSRKSSLRRSRR
jgi:DNA helicase HerA-like ATPase